MISFIHQVFEIRNGPASHVIRTVSFSSLLALLVLLVATASGFTNAPEANTESLLQFLFGALVLAPLVENFLTIMIVEFLVVFRLAEAMVVFIIATLSGLAHGLADDWRAVTGFIFFAVMTRSYLLWREESFGKRYAISLAQHALSNTPVAIATIIDSLG